METALDELSSIDHASDSEAGGGDEFLPVASVIAERRDSAVGSEADVTTALDTTNDTADDVADDDDSSDALTPPPPSPAKGKKRSNGELSDMAARTAEMMTSGIGTSNAAGTAAAAGTGKSSAPAAHGGGKNDDAGVAGDDENPPKKKKYVPVPPNPANRQPANKNLTIPFRTIKRIMKIDDSIGIIQNDAAILVTAAMEHFVKEMASRSLEKAKKAGRNTIKYEDVAEVRSEDRTLSFLDLLIP